MSLVRWNPSRDLLNVEREFNRMFRTLSNRLGFGNGDDIEKEYESAVWMPLTDVYEDKDNYMLTMDLPGISKEDVKISYSDGQLSISGERKQEKESKDGSWHRVERNYGKYFRSFTLPKKIKENNIEAEFKNGQLTITVPKAEEAKPKEIDIKVK
jgi:HSP20 family protein